MVFNLQVFFYTLVILLLPALHSFNMKSMIKSFGIGLINYWLLTITIIFLSNILNIQFLSRELLIVFNLIILLVFIKNNYQVKIIKSKKFLIYIIALLVFFSFFLSIFLDRYLIVGWDEYAKILLWTKTIFLSGNIYDSSLSNFILGDNPGLPILFASSTILFNFYQEYFMVVVYLSFHLSLIFLIYELFEKIIKNNLPLIVNIIIFYLLAELSWKLLPENLQYENIQTYLFSSTFIIFIFYKKNFLDENSFLFCLLTLLLLLVFFKSNYITILPIIFIFLVLQKINYKKLIVFFIPVFLILILIKMQIPETSRCHVNPFSSNNFIFLDYLGLTNNIFNKMINWLLNWKLIISIFAFTFLIISFKDKNLISVSLLFLIWLIAYFIAVSLVINNCFTDTEKNYLFAVERYLSIPFRSLHILGFIFFIFLIPNFSHLINKINFMNIFLLPILLILLITQVYKSAIEITTRENTLKSVTSYNKIKYYNDYINNNAKYIPENFISDVDLRYYELIREYNQLNVLKNKP
jgi:hypothetical protein